jgi:drug/metabolite transporter (DMT)-like permease
VGSHRSARRSGRAAELGARFGSRHPRAALIIVCALLAGVIAICAEQIHHGTYLGRGWGIAAAAGTATAAVVNAAVLISNRRHSASARRFQQAWLVLTVLSASAIRYPFPVGHYDSVQLLFNVLHAALLGYEAVTCAAIVVLLIYVLFRRVGLSGGASPVVDRAVR